MKANAPAPAPRELILVRDAESQFPVGGEEIHSIIKAESAPLVADLIASETIAIRSLFDVRDESQAHEASFTNTLMGVEQPLDLSIFHKVTAPDEMLESLAEAFRNDSRFEAAYIKPGAELPFIDRGVEIPEALANSHAQTPDFTDRQLYLDAAAAGIDALYAWSREGGTGKGVNIIDVEGAWNFFHEDLEEEPSVVAAGVQAAALKWRKHGTAVLGMLGGYPNGFGITGICPDADVRAVSVFGNSNGAPAQDWSTAKAIQTAADMLRPGDIMLIELHQPGPAAGFKENDNNTLGYIPVEWWPCNLAAILYATRRGIIVVEAGGNGSQDLDDDNYNHPPDPPHDPFPTWWRNPFKRNPIDSGAILVGAGLPPGSASKPDRSRWELSNFGESIDAQGWSDNVTTSGGDNDLMVSAEENRWYTGAFSGTSSAAAMVCGALACLQGILIARGDAEILNPASARAFLRDDQLGSPQQSRRFYPASQRIGPRPDLRKLIDLLIASP